MKIAHGTIVLAADGHKILLFRNEGDEKYPVLETLVHDVNQTPPARALGSDRPGRTHQSLGSGRSSYDETDGHLQSEERFARRAASLLADAAAGPNADIVILAPPRFLGWLRENLAAPLRRRAVAEIARDVAHQETDAILAVVGAYENLPADLQRG